MAMCEMKIEESCSDTGLLISPIANQFVCGCDSKEKEEEECKRFPSKEMLAAHNCFKKTSDI